MKTFKTIDAYIADFPKETQKLLKQMRKAISETAPMADEAISYGIPTYKWHGNVVHFGGFKKHIGFFPGPVAIKEFAKELKPYKTSKGTIQFPLDEPLPLGLIKKIVKHRIKVTVVKAKKKK